MTLVIMAAGMGSRFGGLKQIEPVGPNGEFIIDYSIYDAIRVGFDKVVFVIKKENYDLFKETIGKRIEGKVKVEYVFQTNDYMLDDIIIPKDRVKPLGTGHAVLCCKDVVKEPFLLINADDFYSTEGYEKAMEFIKNNNDTNNYGLVGYKVGNTISENGSVKRGICEIKDNMLSKLIESSIELVDNKIVATPLDGSNSFNVNYDTLASMNLFVFYPSIFKYLEEDFVKFLKNSKDLKNDEFLLPKVVCDHINSNDITCEVIDNNAIWKGITYHDDLIDIREYIKSKIDNGEYPNNLYN